MISDLAPTVAIGDDDTGWREQLVLTAEVLGLEVELDERLAAIDAGRSSIEGQNVWVLSVFPGPFIRTYTTGEYDRLGYPSAEGRARFVTDLASARDQL